MPSLPQFYAIIPAAGSGVRFGGGQKKQFFELQGISILERTVTTFLKANLFSKIIVALPQAEQEIFKKRKWPPAIILCDGGKSRSESVYKGFLSLQVKEEDIILIHDAVRPLVSVSLIQRVAKETQERGAVIPVIPVTDTLKEVEDQKVVRTLDRRKIFLVQTPQGFKGRVLHQAYRALGGVDERITDEAMLVESSGEKVYVVEGEKTNIKITTPEDVLMAEFFLKEGISSGLWERSK